MQFFSHIAKVASRFQFDVFVHDVNFLPPSTGAFYCTCERGKKRFRTEHCAVPAETLLTFNEVLSFTATLCNLTAVMCSDALHADKSPDQFVYAKKVFVFRVKSVSMCLHDGPHCLD